MSSRSALIASSKRRKLAPNAENFLALNGQVWRECCCPDADRNINCRPGVECSIVVIGYKLLFTSFPVFFCYVFVVNECLNTGKMLFWRTEVVFRVTRWILWPEIMIANQVTRSLLFACVTNRCLRVSPCVWLFNLFENKLFSPENPPLCVFDTVFRLSGYLPPQVIIYCSFCFYHS